MGKNVSVGAIKNIFDHNKHTTTEIYLHSIVNLEKEEIKIFEKASQKEKAHKDSHTKKGVDK